MIAEFCIRIVDKVDPERFPDQHRRLTHAGDVIEIHPKGFCWGSLDLASPDHIIMAVEVESVEKARLDYLAPEQFDKDKNPLPLRRKAKIDIDQLPAKFKNAIATKDPEAVKAEYQALKDAKKPPIFTEEKQTAFKIPSLAGFEIWDLRVVKPDPEQSPFAVGDDPFEVK
jgi:hypothetical protein